MFPVVYSQALMVEWMGLDMPEDSTGPLDLLPDDLNSLHLKLK